MRRLPPARDADGDDDVTRDRRRRRRDDDVIVDDDVTAALRRGAGCGVADAASYERRAGPTQDPARPADRYT